MFLTRSTNVTGHLPSVRHFSWATGYYQKALSLTLDAIHSGGREVEMVTMRRYASPLGRAGWRRSRSAFDSGLFASSWRACPVRLSKPKFAHRAADD